jgi:hypothetical protein
VIPSDTTITKTDMGDDSNFSSIYDFVVNEDIPIQAPIDEDDEVKLQTNPEKKRSNNIIELREKIEEYKN